MSPYQWFLTREAFTGDNLRTFLGLAAWLVIVPVVVALLPVVAGAVRP